VRAIRRFFYVTGHSIPQSLIDRAFEVNKRYFDMSAEEKAKLPQVGLLDVW
jgi:isopenicillin N synthase-like dioxygenase